MVGRTTQVFFGGQITNNGRKVSKNDSNRSYTATTITNLGKTHLFCLLVRFTWAIDCLGRNQVLSWRSFIQQPTSESIATCPRPIAEREHA